MSANDKQVGGGHYKNAKIEHWDFVAANGLDYFQGQITKYVCRWKDKGGVEDLEKARHFLDKYIEIERNRLSFTKGKLKESHTIAADATKAWPSRKACTCALEGHPYPCPIHNIVTNPLPLKERRIYDVPIREQAERRNVGGATSGYVNQG